MVLSFPSGRAFVYAFELFTSSRVRHLCHRAEANIFIPMIPAAIGSILVIVILIPLLYVLHGGT